MAWEKGGGQQRGRTRVFFGHTERERGYYSLCYRCHTRYSQREPETILLFDLLYYVPYTSQTRFKVHS